VRGKKEKNEKGKRKNKMEIKKAKWSFTLLNQWCEKMKWKKKMEKKLFYFLGKLKESVRKVELKRVAEFVFFPTLFLYLIFKKIRIQIELLWLIKHRKRINLISWIEERYEG
jgi:hypothetical protein